MVFIRIHFAIVPVLSLLLSVRQVDRPKHRHYLRHTARVGRHHFVRCLSRKHQFAQVLIALSQGKGRLLELNSSHSILSVDIGAMGHQP